MKRKNARSIIAIMLSVMMVMSTLPATGFAAAGDDVIYYGPDIAVTEDGDNIWIGGPSDPGEPDEPGGPEGPGGLDAPGDIGAPTPGLTMPGVQEIPPVAPANALMESFDDEAGNFSELQGYIEKPDPGTEINITITGDFNLTGTLVITDNKSVTISGSPITERTLTRGNGVTGHLFTVEAGSKLTLENITIYGDGTNVTGSLVNVNGGGLSLGDGALLTGNNKTTGNGGAVLVSNGGAVYMEAGSTILKNNARNGDGGGVYVSAGSSFYMDGGDINNNGAVNDGGGVYSDGMMTLGGAPEITGNINLINEGLSNVYLANGRYIALNTPSSGMSVGVTKPGNDGVFVQSGAQAGDANRFSADNGDTISFSSGQLKVGAFASGNFAGNFTELQNAIANAPAGVPTTIQITANITITSALTIGTDKNITIMSDSVIRTLTRGPGARGDLFTISARASLTLESIIIDGNEVENVTGSLVNVNGGEFHLGYRADLINNITSANGAAVNVDNGGSFIMHEGSVITGNSTKYGRGGGVYVLGGSVFEMLSGNISDNIAVAGGGVSIYDGVLILSGGSTVTGNKEAGTDAPSNVYLSDDRYITLGTGPNAPNSNMNVGVSKTGNSGIFVNSGAQAQHANYFSADSGDTIGFSNGRLKIGTFAPGVEVGTFAQLQQEIANAPTGVQTIIRTTANITVTSALTIPANRNITITSDSGQNTILRGTGVTGNLFTVNTGTTLSLDRITIDGNKGVVTNASGALVRVTGTLNMEAGAILRNNNRTSGAGAAVDMVTGGLFNLRGGSITGNAASDSSGGCVYMSGGTFNMTGGTISGNTALEEGSGVCLINGTFAMTGGTINNNSCGIVGGGMYVGNGSVTIGGVAKIENNTANGNPDNVYLSDNRYITLGTGANAPATGMRVGVTKTGNSGIFVNAGASAGDATRFFSDTGGTISLQGATLRIMATTTVDAGTFAQLQNAITNAQNNVPTTIRVTAGFSIGQITIPWGKDITITSDSVTRTLTRSAGVSGNLITVDEGAALTLQNIIIDGNKGVVTDANGSLVYLVGDSGISLYSGATLRNNSFTSGYGGGVSTSGTGDSFITMYGGEISGNAANSGGGVYLGLGGNLTMNGGTISGNTAPAYGGGVYISDDYFGESGSGTFMMNGGTISGNYSGNGGGVCNYGGGWFNMSGGTISDNSAVSGGAWQGSINMSGGAITGNTATSSGGAARPLGLIVIGGNAVIQNNTLNGVANNLDLNMSYITLATGANAPTSTMRVGVTKTSNNGVFVQSGANAGHVSNFTADNDGTIVHESGALRVTQTTGVDTFTALQQAIASAPAGVPTTIRTTANITLLSVLTIDANKNITITSDSGYNTLLRGPGVTGNLFTVNAGASLTLTNITISGNKGVFTGASGASGSLVQVNGSFTLATGATLQNNKAFIGGAVSVVSGGSFLMSGGMISGNEAAFSGGVYLAGSFTMTGGMISSNTAVYYAGGVNVEGGTFTVGGGAVIQYNISTSVETIPSNVYLQYAGDYITLGTGVNAPTTNMRVGVTKTGGSGVFVNTGASGEHAARFFSDAEGAIVHQGATLRIELPITAGTFAQLQQAITNAPAGVPTTIRVTADITMTAALSIDTNKNITLTGGSVSRTLTRGAAHGRQLFAVHTGASLTLGNITLDGGSFGVTAPVDSPLVWVNGGSFTMEAGATLQNNIRNDGGNGGGVTMNSGTFNMNGGAISGNSTEGEGGEYWYGGGVSVQGGAFNMTGGTISGNSAYGVGGGVYLYSGSFTMTGGTISGNTANVEDEGGGVYMSGGTFTVGGGARIENNTGIPDEMSGGYTKNVTLENGRYITLGTGANAPNSNMRVGVTKPGDNGKFVLSGAVAADAGRFFSDTQSDIVYESGALWVTPSNDVDNCLALQMAIDNAQNNIPTTIRVSSGFSMTGTVVVPANKIIVITSIYGMDTLRRDINVVGELFAVKAGASLTLKNITIDGNKNNISGFNGPLVMVNGSFTMLEGARLQNNNRSAHGIYGGGVYVNSGGVFNMENGAVIAGNEMEGIASGGSGVYVHTGGTFNMNSGTISGNTAAPFGNGGGVLVWSGGAFNMAGGTLSGNSAMQGGGIQVSSGGNFTMSGGSVSGNSATQRGGGLDVPLGGIVNLGGNARIENNTLDGYANNTNLAEGRYITLGTGANAPRTGMRVGVTKAGNDGVFVNAGASAPQAVYFFADNGNAVTHAGATLRIDLTAFSVGSFQALMAALEQASASLPVTITITADFNFTGGIRIPLGKNITITSGATEHTLTRAPGFTGYMFNFWPGTGTTLTLTNIALDGNAASFPGGASQMVNVLEGSTFIMNEGARLFNNNGGGVMVYGTFRMNGGIITTNKSYSYGSGVYVSESGAITIGGGAEIINNKMGIDLSNIFMADESNVYLPDGKYITLGTGANAPTAYMFAGVTKYANNGVFVSSGASAIHANRFFADNGDAIVFEVGALRIVNTAGSFELLAQAISDAPVGVPTTITVSRSLLMTGNIQIPAGKIITLASDIEAGRILTRSGNFAGNLFTVSAGASLTLDRVSMNSIRTTNVSNITGALVLVDGGEFTIGPNVNLYNNQRTGSGTGGAVSVINSGKFYMYGGRIHGNSNAGRAGGVGVESGGSFIMSGGEIDNNISGSGGGGVGLYGGDSSFTMTGGTIKENRAGNLNGGGVDANGGTVTLGGAAKISGNLGSDGDPNNVDLNTDMYITLGTGINAPSGAMYVGVSKSSANLFVQSGASYQHTSLFFADMGNTIQQNGSGLSLSAGSFRVSNYKQLEYAASRINVEGYGSITIAQSFEMTGTITFQGNDLRVLNIYGNGFTLSRGAGVTGHLFTFNNGRHARVELRDITIDGSRRAGTSGALLYVDGPGVNIYDGVTLRNNTRTGGRGGGVQINSGYFYMYGGVISGNECTSSGGGVDNLGGSFLMSGGSIRNNTAGNGGGVYTADEFIMVGGSIENNTASGSTGGGVGMSVSTAISLGGNARIINNTAGGVVSNLRLGTGSYISLQGSSYAPTNEMCVGVTKPADGGLFMQQGAAEETADFFRGDNRGRIVYDNGKLWVISDIIRVSNFAQLQNAINQAGTTPVVINVTTDTVMTGLITINAGKNITLEGNKLTRGDGVMGNLITVTGGATLTLSVRIEGFRTRDNADGPLVSVSGEGSTLIMNGGWLARNINRDGGGGLAILNGGKCIMNGVTRIDECSANDGGGVYLDSGTLIMNSGSISSNGASNGGGVYIRSGSFIMNGGAISSNVATSDGGGVYVSGGTFAMTGGVISGNTIRIFEGHFSGQAGGVAVNSGTDHLIGGDAWIENNQGTAYAITMTPTPAIVNLRVNQNSRVNIGTGADAPTEAMRVGVTRWGSPGLGAFANNALPENALRFFADDESKHIAFNSGQLEIVGASVNVTYSGNNNTGGSAPAIALYVIGSYVPVSGNTGNLTRAGYNFNGWNTRADGSGTTYMPGDRINNIQSSTFLYAIWVPDIQISAQQGAVRAGPGGVAYFDVTDPVRTAGGVSLTWYADAGGFTTASAPSGVTVSYDYGGSGNITRIIMIVGTSANAGTHYFSVTHGDVKSNIAALVIGEGVQLTGELDIMLDKQTGMLTANIEAVEGGTGNFTFQWSGTGVTGYGAPNLAAVQYRRGEQVTLRLTRGGTLGSLSKTITVYQISGACIDGGTDGTFSIPSSYVKAGEAVACSYNAGNSTSVSFASEAGPVTLTNNNTSYTVNSADAVNGQIKITATFSFPTVLYGDVNGDGAVNRTDHTRMNQFFSGTIAAGATFIEANADVDANGRLNRSDQTRMNQFFAGTIDYLGPNPNQQGTPIAPAFFGLSLLTINEPAVSVSGAAGKPGEEITLTVSLKNASGLSGYGLSMRYDDSLLTFVSAEAADILKDNFIVINRPDGSIQCNSYNSSGAFEIGEALFTVTFKIDENAESGVYGGETLEFIYADQITEGFSVSKADGISSDTIYPEITQAEITVEAAPAVAPSLMSAKAAFISIAETAKNSKVWAMKFTVTETQSDGKAVVVEYTIEIKSNNANVNGKHDLGKYTLFYDVTGNGSNVKEFRAVMN